MVTSDATKDNRLKAPILVLQGESRLSLRDPEGQPVGGSTGWLVGASRGLTRYKVCNRIPMNFWRAFIVYYFGSLGLIILR